MFPIQPLLSLLGGSLLLVCASVPAMMTRAHATPSVFPTGVTQYAPDRTYNSFILFSGADNHTHLIDMDGHEVHAWHQAGFPSRYIDPALSGGEKGLVGVQLTEIAGDGTHKIPGAVAGFRDRTFGYVNWQGKTVWEWGIEAPGGNARQHHDWVRLHDGGSLLLANQDRHLAGAPSPVLEDVIYDVAADGKIRWTWKAGDHLTEFGFTPEQLKLVLHAPSPDYLHINNMQLVGDNHWFREGDTRFAPDNIIIDSRQANFIAIIDRKSGRIVWRLGPDLPQRNFRKPSVPYPVDQFVGQHDAHLIADGLPGAGNLLVFDNQGEAGYPPRPLQTTGGSRILEINPVTAQVVWQYTGEDSGNPPWSFFSSFISSVDRLPNGNTLIDEGMNGRFFQVTPAGDIVWEYVSPFSGNTPSQGGTRPTRSNWVYRIQPVPYDWAPAGTPHTQTPVRPAAQK
ncbi:aryl-sulfate sulfotransferase [Komagataeibacter sp. NFXK3]